MGFYMSNKGNGNVPFHLRGLKLSTYAILHVIWTLAYVVSSLSAVREEYTEMNTSSIWTPSPAFFFACNTQ